MIRRTMGYMRDWIMVQQSRRWLLGVLALAAYLHAASCVSAETRNLYQKKSEYNVVIVREDSDGMRSLIFEENGAEQTSIDMKDPSRLVHAYARAIMSSLAVKPKPNRMLIVGLGGGVMPTFLRRNCPDSYIDVAELDPEVFSVAVKFFNFREDQRMKVHIGDGRKFIEDTRNRYDIIFLDAYGSDSIPYMLATKEFMVAVRAKLADGGIVVSNVWGSGSNKLYGSMVRTYEAVFEELHIIRAPLSENRIHIALPKKAGLTKAKLIDMAGAVEGNLKPRVDLSGIMGAGYQDAAGVEDGKVLLDKDAPKD